MKTDKTYIDEVRDIIVASTKYIVTDSDNIFYVKPVLSNESGDVTTNIAIKIAQSIGDITKADSIAKEIASSLELRLSIEKAEVIQRGIINITFSESYKIRKLNEIEIKAKYSVLIEYRESFNKTLKLGNYRVKTIASVLSNLCSLKCGQYPDINIEVRDTYIDKVNFKKNKIFKQLEDRDMIICQTHDNKTKFFIKGYKEELRVSNELLQDIQYYIYKLEYYDKIITLRYCEPYKEEQLRYVLRILDIDDSKIIFKNVSALFGKDKNDSLDIISTIGESEIKYLILSVDSNSQIDSIKDGYIKQIKSDIESINLTVRQIDSLFKKSELTTQDVQEISRIQSKEIGLIDMLQRYDYTVDKAISSLSTKELVHYLKKLSEEFQLYYHKNTILSNYHSVLKYRMSVLLRVKAVIEDIKRILIL